MLVFCNKLEHYLIIIEGLSRTVEIYLLRGISVHWPYLRFDCPIFTVGADKCGNQVVANLFITDNSTQRNDSGDCSTETDYEPVN